MSPKWMIFGKTFGCSLKSWKIMLIKTSLLSIFMVLISACCYYTSVENAMTVGLFITIVGSAIYFGIALSLKKGKKYEIPEKDNLPSVASVILQKMVEMHKNFHPCEKRTIISRNVDAAIQDIMDLTIRDYIMTWYSELAKDTERFPHIVEDELWHIVEKLSERLQNIDMVDFMTRDLLSTLHKHFEDIKEANAMPPPGKEKKKFMLHPWLSTDDAELEFLRTVADVMLIHLLPDQYAKVQSVRHLLKEILACAMFRPMIELLCDPDHINQTLYNWLDYRERLVWEHKSTYTYAATYESFMEMIEKCTELEHLKQMRYNIISEIIQATAIQHFKRLKGEDTEKEYNPKGTTKGHLLRARNLSRYINQLSICKSYCEKRIYLLGGPDYKSYTSVSSEEEINIPGRKVLSFAVIMQTEGARNHFFKYLMNTSDDALLRFWAAVENMKHTPKNKWHKQAGEMYEMFLAHAGSLLRLYFEKSLIKRLEAFMKGDMGPDAFHEAQDQVYKTLEEKFYPSFIVSDLYRQYMGSPEHKTHIPSLAVYELSDQIPESEVGALKNVHKDTVRIIEHCTYAHSKLKTLEEKFDNKSQALQALRLSQKHDPKILKLREEMEGEIESLKQERRQLEFHIERTDLWAANIGKWKAHIYNSEIVEEEGRKVGYFVIVVHLPGMLRPHKSTAKSKSSTQGWVISRKLDDFLALHKKLIQVKPILNTMDLSFVKLKQKDLTEEKLKQMKESLEDYLIRVLKDEQLAQSETIFAFFSPSPEHLKHHPEFKPRGKFSLANFFKSSTVQPKDDSSESDDELIFAEENSFEKEDGKANDSIAGQLYRLIGEVFEVKGVFKWFRKTFIVFVKVTFGRSVNRQLRSTVNWMFSEPMIIYYLQLFKDTYWPNGQLPTSRQQRSDEEKLQSRFMAKEKFNTNIPDALQNLVGEHNAKQGAIKVFEALQEPKLNKHLLYNVMLLLIYELFPEINDDQQEKTADVQMPDDSNVPDENK